MMPSSSAAWRLSEAILPTSSSSKNAKRLARSACSGICRLRAGLIWSSGHPLEDRLGVSVTLRLSAGGADSFGSEGATRTLNPTTANPQAATNAITANMTFVARALLPFGSKNTGRRCKDTSPLHQNATERSLHQGEAQGPCQ